MRGLLLAVFLFFLISTPVVADHQRILPNVPTVVMTRAMERGYVTYRLDANAAKYPNFRNNAAAVALSGLNIIGLYAVEIYEGVPDIWLTMPEDTKFLSTCGQGAAGCIYYWADPVMIFFRQSLLYFDWKTTIAHEGINYGHAMGEHEQYYDSNGQFACKTSATYTVMSCGTGVWEVQPYDREVVWGLTVPSPVAGYYGISYTEQGPLGYYCNTDTKRGTRVAIMAVAPWGEVYWSGVHLPVSSGCLSFLIVGDTGWCYDINVENGFSWRLAESRNDTRLGCI